jgi:hypothetical protein
MEPHGALLIAGTATLADFDPVIAHPVPTSTAQIVEPAFDTPAWFPARIFTVNRLGEEDRLVVVPAQFLGTEQQGTLRRFSHLTVTVVYSDSVDFTPPVIWEVNSIIVADTASFSVSADDASGVERVLVTTSTDGQTWRSHDLSYVPYAQLWETTLSGLTEDTSYFVQVMDAAGNVTVSDNKGQYHIPQQRNIFLPVVLRSS